MGITIAQYQANPRFTLVFCIVYKGATFSLHLLAYDCGRADVCGCAPTSLEASPGNGLCSQTNASICRQYVQRQCLTHIPTRHLYLSSLKRVCIHACACAPMCSCARSLADASACMRAHLCASTLVRARMLGGMRARMRARARMHSCMRARSTLLVLDCASCRKASAVVHAHRAFA